VVTVRGKVDALGVGAAKAGELGAEIEGVGGLQDFLPRLIGVGGATLTGSRKRIQGAV